MTFDEIMAPLGAEAFTRDYLGQQPLHLQGSADKFAAGDELGEAQPTFWA